MMYVVVQGRPTSRLLYDSMHTILNMPTDLGIEYLFLEIGCINEELSSLCSSVLDLLLM